MKGRLLLALLVTSVVIPHSSSAQGTAFTYQGRLNDGANPANGNYDLRFIVYTADPGGSQVGPVRTNAATAVSGGLFVVTLDFGFNVFTSADRYLEVAVRTNGGPAFTTLSPRQKLTPAPYAIFAENLASGGLAAGVYANAFLFNNPANSFYGDGLGLVNLSAAQLSAGTVPDARLAPNIARLNQVWRIGGNAGTSSDFIGTTDDQPFDVRVNNVRVMRYRLNTDVLGSYSNAPNVIGGSSVNGTVASTVVGATIAGGGGNLASDGTSYANRVTANFGTVGGGRQNTVGGDFCTVAGGDNNTASGALTTVGGGNGNSATSLSATVGGGNNNTASGENSTIPGGAFNTASRNSSFAAGYRAKADDYGCFVWADLNEFDFHSANTNQFAVRCTGGAKFVTAIDNTGAQTAGVRLQPGDTAWSSISDRNAKKNFQPVNAEGVLEKLAAMPLQSWNYKWEPDDAVPHLGPMAQDFKAAFYPGRDDKSISTLEFDGVELAAIQGLNRKLDERINTLERELSRRDAENAELRQELGELKTLVRSLKATEETDAKSRPGAQRSGL